jgi:serine/threonine protein kinase
MLPIASQPNDLCADSPPSWDQLSADELLRFDSLCDQFEAAYLLNSGTRIEDYVTSISPEQRVLVEAELIEVEWSIRQTRGESPSPAEYIARFPDCKQAIEQIIAACDSDHHASVTLQTTKSNAGEMQRTLHASGTTVVDTAAAPAWFSTPMKPSAWGHFEIQNELGRGGMGIVYRARDKKLDRDIALKVLTPEAYKQPHACERFLREAKAAAVVRHPNVVMIYSVEVFDGAPLIAMELVEGVTLEAHLKQHGRMSSRDVAKLGSQLAAGLAAAHQRGLVHRDVKPANILLELNDQASATEGNTKAIHAKLTDFGLARAASDLSLTHPDIIAGTPPFMSPEQASGIEVDHRSDLFSLGSVLYAACLGKPAFVAETIPGILHKVTHTMAVPLKQCCPGTDASLSDLIERLMAKSPARRIQSAEEAANRFDEIATRLSEPLPQHSKASLSSAKLALTGRHLAKWAAAGCILWLILSGLFILRTGDGEFIIETDDPNIAAMLGPDQGIVVEDQSTKLRYVLKRGVNRLPSGDYDLQVNTPDGLQITTPKFTLQRDGKVQATVSARELNTVTPQKTTPSLDESPLLNPEYRWSTPINLGAGINTEAGESHPTLTGDGLTLVFVRNGKAYQATRDRIGRTFREPTMLLGAINDEGDLDSPYLSKDGLTIVFASSRQGTLGENDLWTCTRSDLESPFSTPVNLGPDVNTIYEDSTPSLSTDGLTLWFCAFRNDRNQQVDLYEATRPSIDMPFSQATRLPGAINGPGNDFFPRPAFEDHVLFFTVTNESTQQVHYARRSDLSMPFRKPQPFVFGVDNGVIGTIALSADGQVMIYDSNRPSGKGGVDLWLVRSVKAQE